MNKMTDLKTTIQEDVRYYPSPQLVSFNFSKTENRVAYYLLSKQWANMLGKKKPRGKRIKKAIAFVKEYEMWERGEFRITSKGNIRGSVYFGKQDDITVAHKFDINWDLVRDAEPIVDVFKSMREKCERRISEAFYGESFVNPKPIGDLSIESLGEAVSKMSDETLYLTVAIRVSSGMMKVINSRLNHTYCESPRLMGSIELFLDEQLEGNQHIPMNRNQLKAYKNGLRKVARIKRDKAAFVFDDRNFKVN